jgi:hypothetical protein
MNSINAIDNTKRIPYDHSMSKFAEIAKGLLKIFNMCVTGLRRRRICIVLFKVFASKYAGEKMMRITERIWSTPFAKNRLFIIRPKEIESNNNTRMLKIIPKARRRILTCFKLKLT